MMTPLTPVAAMRTRVARALAAVPAALLALAGAACSDPPAPNGGAPARLTELPRPLTGAEREVLSASNDFAFSLLAKVNERFEGENVFISPLSASMALGMTMNGTAGETQAQMRRVLGFGDVELRAANASYRDLSALLRSIDPEVDFRVANSIWHDRTFAVEPSFLATTREYFDARAEALDFGSPAALGTINGWVSESTNGKIPTILDEIRRDDVMYLINAIYFKGSWRRRFDPARTCDATFTLDDGSTRTVKMMHRAPDTVRVYGSAAVTLAELEYGNGAYAMTIALPPRGTSVDAFVRGLTPARWAAWTDSLADASLDVYLPKFRLEWEDRLERQLIELGMPDAFTCGIADFTPLSSSAGRELCITLVKQKTFVDVNEEGTEAAAATAVGIGRTSLPPAVSIDRPFVFAIRERLSGAILFVGKIAEPRS